MTDSRELRLYSESKLSSPVSGGLVASNPAIDLVATVSDGNVLNIWRAHGQQVSKHVDKNRKVEALRWKDDGQFLAAAWSDGVIRLMGLENSKAVHHIRVADESVSPVSHVAWSRNHIGKRRSRKPSKPTNSWDKLLNGDLDVEQDGEILDLPHELTFLEVDTALPKLSPLPVSGGSGDDTFVFSTRTSLDFVFRPFKSEDTETVDIMIVGTENGEVHLSIYDSFVIGKFGIGHGRSKADSEILELCCHASHPDLSTHSLLLTPRDDNRQAVYLTPMDLTFVHSSPINLPLLASKTTTLQNLIRYIRQTQVHMIGEWKSTRELPHRFLAGVSEDLQNMPKRRMSLVQAFYHTVITGHVPPPVKAWLVDSLAERGHKRWDKAVMTGLEGLRALVHENMIPALERASMILSRLLGLARYHGTSSDIGFTAAEISKLLEIVSCLTLSSHKMLLLVMEELDLFGAFSAWLRFEIDKQASSSTPIEDLAEKEATIDTAKVLTYVQRHLTDSPLAVYLDDVGDDDWAKDRRLADDGANLLDTLDRQLRRREAGQPHMQALPRLKFLVDYLADKAKGVFDAIAEMQRRSVRFARQTVLEIGHSIDKYDMRMCAERVANGPGGLTYTVLASETSPGEVYIFRTQIEIINAISSPLATEVCGLSLAGGSVIDFNFLSDVSLLLLWKAKDAPPALLHVPFQNLSYSSYVKTTLPAPSQIAAEDVTRVFSAATFGNMPDFTPVKMQALPRNSTRGDIPDRVCLLGRDKVSYKAFALPEQWGDV